MINITTDLNHTFILRYLPYIKKTLFSYLFSIIIIISCTIVSIFFYPYLKESNLIMVYLLGVIIVALQGKTRPAVLASILSVLSYEFFFIPPFLSFSISDIQFFFTFIVMQLVAHIISQLIRNTRKYMEVTKIAQSETEEERLRNILLTSVSHDLRTPLTAIMGSASLLLQSGSLIAEDIQKELLQNIYDESEQLNHLVNNILRLIRLESGPIKLEKQSNALEDILGVTLNKLEKRLLNRPILTYIPKQAPLISFDSTLMGKVKQNIEPPPLRRSVQIFPLCA